jgi:hypothetical protein
MMLRLRSVSVLALLFLVPVSAQAEFRRIEIKIHGMD